MSYSDEFTKRALNKASIENWRKEKRLYDALGFIRYLEKLNPELAEIYWRKHWKGESIAIIAKVMGLTEPQVCYKRKRAQDIIDKKRGK